MAIRLIQDWNGHAAGAVINNLAPWEERALINGQAAEAVAETRVAVAAPDQVEDEKSAADLEGERRSQLLIEIEDLGGDKPHPNTGMKRLEEIRDALAQERNERRVAEEADDA